MYCRAVGYGGAGGAKFLRRLRHSPDASFRRKARKSAGSREWGIIFYDFVRRSADVHKKYVLAADIRAYDGMDCGAQRCPENKGGSLHGGYCRAQRHANGISPHKKRHKRRRPKLLTMGGGCAGVLAPRRGNSVHTVHRQPRLRLRKLGKPQHIF